MSSRIRLAQLSVTSAVERTLASQASQAIGCVSDCRAVKSASYPRARLSNDEICSHPGERFLQRPRCGDGPCVRQAGSTGVAAAPVTSAESMRASNEFRSILREVQTVGLDGLARGSFAQFFRESESSRLTECRTVLGADRPGPALEIAFVPAGLQGADGRHEALRAGLAVLPQLASRVVAGRHQQRLDFASRHTRS
jgi:hypothetical protein